MGTRLAVILLTATGLLICAGDTAARAAVIYWRENDNIYRANDNGTSKQQVFSSSISAGYASYFDLDVSTQKMYVFGHNGSGQGIVWRSNLDGSNYEPVISSGLTLPASFALNPTEGKMYLGRHIGMSRANMDGSGLQAMPQSPFYPHDMQVDPVNQEIYYSDAVSYNGIRKSNLDGSNVQNVVNYGGGDIQSIGLALDLTNSQIFFSRYNTDELRRVNLDGTNEQVLISGLLNPQDVELDLNAGKIYWTSENYLQRANLDGSGLENLVAINGANWGADSLAIDTTMAAVPEPSSMVLVSSIATIAWLRRRRLRSHTCN